MKKSSYGMLGKHHTIETKRKIGFPQIGSKNNRWIGGRVVDGYGYIYIYKPEHPFRNNRKYVREHRLIVEQLIGRFLKPEEAVHHINEIKDDNRPENLIAFVNLGYHCAFHKWNYDNPKYIIFDGRKLH